MKILVFGASGQVGQYVVKKLLSNGHTVKIFTHNTNPFPDIESMSGDIHDANTVSDAIEGCDAVICTLGSWHTKTKDIQVSAMSNIIPAMKKHNVKKIVSVTGSGVFDENDTPSLFDKLNRTLLRIVATKVFSDGEQHIAMLRKSELDWVVIRSPIMNNHGVSGKYTLNTTFPKPWETVLRSDVALAMTHALTDITWLRSAPFIHRS